MEVVLDVSIIGGTVDPIAEHPSRDRLISGLSYLLLKREGVPVKLGLRAGSSW